MVTKILQLLKDKNDHLADFIEINEMELPNIVAGDFTNLERFYVNRESLLNMVRIIDHQIDEINRSQLQMVVLEGDQERLRMLLAEKDELVRHILNQDLQILSRLESEKSDIIKNLRVVQQTKKALGAYGQGL